MSVEPSLLLARLSTLYILSHLILSITLGSEYYCPPFPEEETKAQRQYVACSSSSRDQTSDHHPDRVSPKPVFLFSMLG